MPDPFTHYVFAYLLGRGLKLKEAQLRVFLVLTFVPDFDAVSILFGAFSAFHGTVTHSILGSLALGAAALIPLSFLFRAGMRAMLPYFALPVLLHLGLDFFKTGYGTVGIPYLWPFDPSPYSTFVLFGSQFALATHAALLALALGSAALLALRKEYLWGLWKSYLRKR